MRVRPASAAFIFAFFALICAIPTLGLTQKLQPPGDQPQGETQGSFINRITPELTVDLLKAAGYTDLDFYTDDQGNKQVKGKINAQVMVVVHFYEKGATQQFISFVAPLGKQQGVDLNWINSWNFNRLFLKLSQDKEGNMLAQMDVHFFGGVSPNYITASGELFGEMIKALYQYEPGK